MRLFSRSIPFLAAATPAGGGSLAPIQTSTVDVGVYDTAEVTMTLTAGSTVIISAAAFNLAPTITSSQGDTIVATTFNILSANYRNTLAYVLSAVGGSTTFTISVAGNDGNVSIGIQEWPAMVRNTAAGIGQAEGNEPVSVSTPSPTDVADTVTFSIIGAFGFPDMTTQTVPSGYTEIQRHTLSDGSNAARVQFVSAYRLETATGVKTAAWPVNGSADKFVGAQILSFQEA